MKRKYQIGTVVFNNWTIKKRIGAGSFGEVFEIQREDFGQIYSAALKVITVPQNSDEFREIIEDGMSPQEAKQYFYSVVEDVVREFAIMSKFKGTANIVSYEDHDVIEHADGQGWDIIIRMELLTPLKTFTLNNPFTRRDIIRLGIDMLKALELCQKYNVIHRDIKPENIFISSNGDFKLGDFGIARTIEKTTSGMSKKGTYTYMAPEVYLGKEYGFSVDTYSLGLVLYRLLNKSRAPFLPPAPEPITHNKQEAALVKRMSGETIQKPFYADGRLAEIVLKACSFDSRDRYSSPMEMREELEAILYDADEAEFIYPAGDDVELPENRYLSKTPEQSTLADDFNAVDDETDSGFGNWHQANGNIAQGFAQDDLDRTESLFGKRKTSSISEPTDTDRTQSNFGKRPVVQDKKIDRRADAPWIKDNAPKSEPVRKKKTALWIGITLAAIVLVAGALGFYINNQQKAERERTAQYNDLISSGLEMCQTNPEQAKDLFVQALELNDSDPNAHTGYAYALYCEGSYDDCISYIEDDLALGKNYEVSVQNRLSEILASAYFEKQDYAEAAAFFRLSTAGEDITVSAMRDYAVSLGRLGDVFAAEEVLQRMYDSGADDDVTDYVQAEVNFALEKYVEAETGFLAVLNETSDTVLQKRCVRSLGEVYRDCAALARINESPILYPATKSAEFLSNSIVTYGLRYDSTMWEMLALAYFEAYHTDSSVTDNYLVKAAECFNRVIELGVQKDYLYSNLYTIYYELADYTSAEAALVAYEEAFPQDYMPHALRAMMLITIENEKTQENRNYSKAVSEYEIASSMLRSDDDTTYYLQLESLIKQLREKGWII